MIDDFGATMTDDQALAEVERIGSTVVHRAPVESEDVPAWRSRLRRAARERGFRISVRHVADRCYVIYNPDHVVSRERLRATVEAVAVPPVLEKSSQRRGSDERHL